MLLLSKLNCFSQSVLSKFSKKKHHKKLSFRNFLFQKIEGIVVPWCNPPTLQPEQSGGVDSNPGRVPPLERHDKGSWTRLDLLYFWNPSAWR